MAYKEGAQRVALEPVPTALNRTSQELLKFVEMIGDLEAAVGHAIAGTSGNHDFQIQELQKLDHVRQMVEGAADFLHALTENMPLDWRVDARKAARSVRLAELASRLGESEGAEAQEAPPPVQNYELFD